MKVVDFLDKQVPIFTSFCRLLAGSSWDIWVGESNFRKELALRQIRKTGRLIDLNNLVFRQEV